MYIEACNFASAISLAVLQFRNFAILKQFRNFDFQNDYAISNVPDAFYDTRS